MGAGVVCDEYNVMTIELLFRGFNVYIFVDLVKLDVLTLVGEIAL